MKHIAIFLAFQLLLSCTSRDSSSAGDPIEITFSIDDLNEEPEPESFIEEMTVIPLKNNLEESFYLSDDIQVVENGDAYFVLDFRNKQIVKYASDGDFMTFIGRKGKGPGEYVFPRGIFEYNDGVALYDAAQNKISHYGQNGDYLNAVAVEDLNYFDRIYKIRKGYIGLRMPSYGLYNTQEKNHLIIVWDQSYKTVASYYPVEIAENGILTESFISKSSKDRIYFFSLFGSLVYEINPLGIVPAFKLNFGDYQMPEMNFFKASEQEAMDMFTSLNSNDYVSCRSMYQNSETVLFRINYIKRKKESYALYNKEMKKFQGSFPISYGQVIGVGKDGTYIMKISLKNLENTRIKQELATPDISTDSSDVALIKYKFK